jgi:hypothetical protein
MLSTPGTDVMILKLFRKKNWQQNLAFVLKTKLNNAKKWITRLVFEKNGIFSPKLAKIAENWRKSPKIGENRRKL